MEKEQVKQFDLEAAFKALDEIETPKVEGGVRANKTNFKETFCAKTSHEVLVEDYYDITSKEELNAAKEERDAEVAKAKLARIEKIVDLDAESPEDLQPSYVGKVIIQCPQCMTLFYKDPDDIQPSEENPNIVNVSEVCQHCGNESGYNLIGKVDVVGEDEADKYDAEDFDENELDLDFPEAEEESDEPVEEPSEEDVDALDLDLGDEVEAETEEDVKESLNEATDLDSISDEERGESEEIKKSPDWEATQKYILYGTDVNDKVLVERNFKNESKKAADVKAARDAILDENEDVVDVFVARFYKNKETGEEKEIPLYSYTISRPGFEYAGIGEGYTGNPAERTTHLEYEDKDPADGKAVLPDNIEKQLTEAKAKYLIQASDEDGEVIEEFEVEGNDPIAEFEAYVNEHGQDFYDITLIDLKDYSIVKNYSDGAINENLKEGEECKDGECEKPLEECGENCEKPLTEEVDKDLDAKLKAHNDYIDYLQQMIKQEEEALKKADNEEVKAAIQRRLDSLNADLKDALPEAVKEDSSDLPTPEELDVEEVAEEEPKEDEANESLKEDTEVDYVDYKHSYCHALEPKLKQLNFLANVKGASADELKKIILGVIKNSKDVKITDKEKEFVDNIKAKDNAKDIYHYIKNSINKAKETYAKVDDEGELVKESLTEGVHEKNATIEDETKYQGVDNAVVDCEKNLVVAHSEDEKPVDCKMEKPALEKPLAGDKVDIKVNEAVDPEIEAIIASWKFDENLKEAANPEDKVLTVINSWPNDLPATQTTAQPAPVANNKVEDNEINSVMKNWSYDENLNEADVANLDDLLDSPEFKKPITDAEVKSYFEGCENGKCEEACEGDDCLVDIDDLDECSLNKHINEYLQSVYSNVKSYETVGCSLNEGKLIVEGKISFNSGKERNTTFEFTPKAKNILEGYNKEFSAEKAFTLNYSINEAKAFVTESFGYNYKIGENLVEGLK